jgi:hypothetical protein
LYVDQSTGSHTAAPIVHADVRALAPILSNVPASCLGQVIRNVVGTAPVTVVAGAVVQVRTSIEVHAVVVLRGCGGTEVLTGNALVDFLANAVGVLAVVHVTGAGPERDSVLTVAVRVRAQRSADLQISSKTFVFIDTCVFRTWGIVSHGNET